MDLDLLDEIQNYRKLFMDAGFWQPYVAAAMERSGLPCHSMRGGIPGTCPTFIVDDAYIVKFFGRLFDGEKSFQVELNANLLMRGQSNFPLPGLIAQGKLMEDDLHWYWPYLVFEYLEGISIGEAWGALTLVEKQLVYEEMGRRVRALHSMPLDANCYFDFTWDTFRVFLDTQQTNLFVGMDDLGWIPAHFKEQLRGFLLPLDQLFAQEVKPHLIHADLTRDHLLGTVKDGNWNTLGVIDFGDAMVGDFFYELIAVHLDLLQGEKQMLRKFLEGYGYELSSQTNFSQRAMNMTLLHQFGENILTDLFHRRPNLTLIRNLDELANEIWGL
jgi:hygromycin-B 7''-O-kinase